MMLLESMMLLYNSHLKTKNVLSFKNSKEPLLINENTCNTAKNDWGCVGKHIVMQ